MLRSFSSSTFFLIIACLFRHGDTNTCGTKQMRTPAGLNSIGCEPICDSPLPLTGLYSNFPQLVQNIKVLRPEGHLCLTISPDAWKYIVQAVNYTCELGMCNEKGQCMPFDLLIECWRE
uniref:Evasin n=1 Tax=Rhipicephalus microplus TaxID=6941 RepID=A0A6G5A580_RHIMP